MANAHAEIQAAFIAGDFQKIASIAKYSTSKVRKRAKGALEAAVREIDRTIKGKSPGSTVTYRSKPRVVSELLQSRVSLMNLISQVPYDPTPNSAAIKARKDQILKKLVQGEPKV